MDDKESSGVKKKKLLISWQDRATRASIAHYFQAQSYSDCNTYLTIFNLVSAISILFLANNKLFEFESSLGSSIMISIASLAVVLSSTLQYVLRLGDKARDHKLAGNEFTAIKRKIEILMVDEEIFYDEKIFNDCINRIADEHNHVSKHHNLVRKKIWEKIKQRHSEAIEENQGLIDAVECNGYSESSQHNNK